LAPRPRPNTGLTVKSWWVEGAVTVGEMNPTHLWVAGGADLLVSCDSKLGLSVKVIGPPVVVLVVVMLLGAEASSGTRYAISSCTCSPPEPLPPAVVVSWTPPIWLSCCELCLEMNTQPLNANASTATAAMIRKCRACVRIAKGARGDKGYFDA
jgi:hypothetical protein